MTASDQTFQALVGDQVFEFILRDGTLLQDGKPVSYSFEAISPHHYALIVEGRSFPLVIESASKAAGHLRITLAGREVEVQVKDEQALLLERFGLGSTAGAAEREIHAPMPGLVVNVLVSAGMAVEPGTGLLVLEAMKMENEIRAQAAGVVKAVHVQPGDAVGKNALLIELE